MHAKESRICIGANVLMHRDTKHKAMSPWDPVPFVVTAVNGTMVTASRFGHSTTRNSSWFKPEVRNYNPHVPILKERAGTPVTTSRTAATDEPPSQTSGDQYGSAPAAATVAQPPADQSGPAATDEPASQPSGDQYGSVATAAPSCQPSANQARSLPPSIIGQSISTASILKSNARGRPSKEQSAINKAQSERDFRAKRASNPPVRKSTRFADPAL